MKTEQTLRRAFDGRFVELEPVPELDQYLLVFNPGSNQLCSSVFIDKALLKLLKDVLLNYTINEEN